MREDVNLQWRIAARPVGNVRPSDFRLAESPVPEAGPGQMLLKTRYLGLAPVMRMYMQGLNPSGETALEIGDVIHGRGVAEVVESHHPDYRAGDIVQGQLGWQTWKVTSATPRERFFKCKDYGLPYALGAGVLGMTGVSAYWGLLDGGRPKEGDLAVVSGAAGGVGSIVVQMLRILGCRVIGIAGGPEKCRFIRELGCAEVIDYKNEDACARVGELCPDGMDLYFDNVGGELLAACLDNLAFGARIVLCGSISEYLREERFALGNYLNLRRVNGSMSGFFVYNYQDRFDDAFDGLAAWIRAGSLKPIQDVVEGFENMPDALARLYDGRNVGVQCCSVRGEPEN
ncbi:NADP-dependent oxidoreductase [Candidatus Foliamicus sp.]